MEPVRAYKKARRRLSRSREVGRFLYRQPIRRARPLHESRERLSVRSDGSRDSADFRVAKTWKRTRWILGLLQGGGRERRKQSPGAVSSVCFRHPRFPSTKGESLE